MYFSKIVATGAGDTTLIAGVAGQRIKIISYTYATATTVSVKFLSGSTDLTGSMALAANTSAYFGSGDRLPSTLLGCLKCAEGEDFKINLSGIAVVGGHLTYTLEAV